MSTKQPHPQAEILKAIAEDKDAQIEIYDAGNKWQPCTIQYILRFPEETYRIAPKPDADGWIPWHGGENPVPGKMVECMLSAGHRFRCAADSLSWRHNGDCGGIVAYRVVEPKPAKKVYYLWAYEDDERRLKMSPFLRIEGEEYPVKGAIRLDWSRTEVGK